MRPIGQAREPSSARRWRAGAPGGGEAPAERLRPSCARVALRPCGAAPVWRTVLRDLVVMCACGVSESRRRRMVRCKMMCIVCVSGSSSHVGVRCRLPLDELARSDAREICAAWNMSTSCGGAHVCPDVRSGVERCVDVTPLCALCTVGVSRAAVSGGCRLLV